MRLGDVMKLQPAPKRIRDKFKAELERIIAETPKPIVCLPLMRIPAREVEKGTKFLPEMWKPEDGDDG